MGIVTIGHSASGMAKNLDRRLRDMLVVICRTGLAEVLEHPGVFFPRLNARLGFDTGKTAQCAESLVWPCSSAIENGSIRIRVFWHDALDVGIHGPIHRPAKRLTCLHASIE